MASFLRSLLLLGLPGFDAPLDSGQRQIKALHQANRLAFLGQHALLYCLLDDNGIARRHLQESLAGLEASTRQLQCLLTDDTLKQQAAALQPLLHSYALLLPAASGDDLRRIALLLSESLLARTLALAAALAVGGPGPVARWLALCGQAYAYSQRTVCLLAVRDTAALHIDRPALLLECRVRCHGALNELSSLARCHEEIADLLSELDRLHSTPPHEPGAPWLHHVSSSLLHSLQRLERPEQ
ncbi:hypothetical protein [Aquipseudomonas alcaligenes]|uniref:Uncharacterized protein n=1 Tax=Aquipseudomonas alcaligenes TaxID=43263 RepID=A0AA42N179_AQUAC|nr:hypothetical protein [Pseudomonas alcaligenes]MDH1054562.1 hypothetical protein [Pseudomonas alcaligenes]